MGTLEKSSERTEAGSLTPVALALRFPSIAVTLAFICLFRLSFLMAVHLHYGTTAELPSVTSALILFPALAFLVFWFVARVASRFSVESLRQRFRRHPFLTITLALLFLVDLFPRVRAYDPGSGLVRIWSAFEVVVYLSLITFLWWVSLTWFSERVLNARERTWRWYEATLNFALTSGPSVYRVILGLVLATFVASMLVTGMRYVSGYSGADVDRFAHD